MFIRSIFIMSTALTVAGLFAAPARAVEIIPTPAEAQAAAAAASGPTAAAAAPATTTPNRIRVKYREGPQAAAASAGAPDIAASVAQTSDARIQTRQRSDSTEDIVLDRQVSGQELGRIAETLARNPAVEWAVPETIERAQVEDPLFNQQWNYHQAKTGIRLRPAWTQSTGKDVVVAVLDTGFRKHVDIASHLLTGYDFVSNPGSSNDGDGRDPDASDPGDWCPTDPPQFQRSSWHGLHVAGTIAAVTDNGIGVAGVAPGVKILPVRVLGQCGGSNLDISDAILWAAGLPIDGVTKNPTPARVINLSLGAAGPCDPAYADAIRKARQQGVTVVVAAGNSDIDASGFRPANCEGVISVAATNRVGARAYFGRPGAGSNFGASVKVAAPGGETSDNPENGILSTMNDGIRAPGNDSYKAYQGTSMAAPHVAGVVALMYQVHPNILPDEALSILRATSQPFPIVTSRQCDTSSCGAGIIDAEAAVAEAAKRGSMISAASGATTSNTNSKRP